MDMGCTHHWVIAPPDGREPLPGRCRRCGAERSFRATLTDDEETAAYLVLQTRSLSDGRSTVDSVRRAAAIMRQKWASRPISDSLVRRLCQVLRRHGALEVEEMAAYAPCMLERAARAVRERPEFILLDDGRVALAEWEAGDE